jgi:hypothetical protein
MSQFRAQASTLQTRGRGQCILILLLTMGILFGACPAYCTDYYVAPDGNDSNDGSIDHPFKTIPKAVSMVVAGNTIYLRGGQHDYTNKISISKSGDANNPIILQAYQDEVPILDYSGEPYGSSYRGINLSGSYWHFKGFTIQYAGDNGINVTGSYNIFERLVLRRNGDPGLQLHTGSSYNLVLNCDSYLNFDPDNNGEDADGFAAKFSVGPGNVFRGCRAWNNSDDGWDLWQAGNSGNSVRIEDCWAFRNGVNLWGVSPFNGDGQGIKLGEGTGAHVVIRCMSYNNQHNGFDRNGNTTGTTLYNCTGVNNLSYNYRFDLSSSTFVMRNNISHLGTNTIAANVDDTYNTWNSGFSVSDADFASLDPNMDPIVDPNTYDNADSIGIDRPRGPDGELPKLRFLRLARTSSLIDAGIDVNQPFYGDAPDLGAFEYIDGDCEPDGDVDWSDLWCLASNWLDVDCGDCNGADFDGNGDVDLYDFAVMAGNWLK